MRDYSKVAPQFWIGSTGRELRGKQEGQIVAFYLLTNPHANMLGMYYLPMMFIAHETGLGMEGAAKGLKWASEAGFCGYDDHTEVVWVYEMARFQIGDQLDPHDKRCKGVQNEYDTIPKNRFLSDFYGRYAQAFHMTRQRGEHSPIQAPSEPHRSQEQEQEQEQEHEQDQNNTRRAKAPRFDCRAFLIDKGVTEPVCRDWLALRKQKRAPVTETAINGIVREAQAAGMTLDAVLALCCQRGWQGFKAEWVQEGKSGSAYKTVGQERAEVAAELTGKASPSEPQAQQQGKLIEGESRRVA